MMVAVRELMEDGVGKRSEKISFDFHPRQNLGCVTSPCASQPQPPILSTPLYKTSK